MLIREVKDPRVSDAMASVLRVETSSDLKFCKVFVSALLVETDQERTELMKGLKSTAGFLRGGLGRNLTLRNTPELSFVIDDSIERSVRITNMLRDMNIDDEQSTDAQSDSGVPE